METTNRDEAQLKKLFAETRMKASENLQYRIMQQIETEKQLSKSPVSSKKTFWKGLLTTITVSYSIIIVALCSIYLEGTRTMNPRIWAMIILIPCICLLFHFISTFDDARQQKRKQNSK